MTMNSPHTKTLCLLAAAVIAALLALGAFATGQASAASTCNRVYGDGVTIEVSRWGTTSCQMARATAVQAARLMDHGVPPRVMRVRSPKTHRTYTMRRVSFEDRFNYWSVVYSGRGANGSTINVQLRGWLS
jgi:hypothetical protein